jgi:hypothetical protein
MVKKFTSKKEYEAELNAVYAFHCKVFRTVLALLRRKGDEVLKRGIRFSFLEMDGIYTVNAVRLSDDGKEFYLEATGDSGDEYTIDWVQINHDMIITEWLMGLRFPITYPDYDYTTVKWEK